MKFVFIVQSEGRGHLSQAIVLADWLEECGHEIVTVLLGKNKRVVPSYFFERFGASKIQTYDSPSFLYTKDHKGLHLFKTFMINLYYARRFLKSILFVKTQIRRHQPDVVVNFYDLIGGLAHITFKKKHKYKVISHHYYLTHPDHKLVCPHFWSAIPLQTLNRLTAIGADAILALSFRAGQSHKSKVHIVPPIMRQEVMESLSEDQNYILAYSVNKGYAQEVKEWQKNHSEIVVHYFGDVDLMEDMEEVHQNLFFHKLDQVSFVKYLSGCKAYATTAGFESVCEASYLGKNIMLVPVHNHFEQVQNAKDAQRLGNCIVSDTFNLDRLLSLKYSENDSVGFRSWCNTSKSVILKLLTQ